MIIVIAASRLAGEGKCHECTSKQDRSTRQRTRIHLRASDSLGRKEPQRARGSDPSTSDAGPNHGDLAVRTATGQHSASWIQTSALRCGRGLGPEHRPGRRISHAAPKSGHQNQSIREDAFGRNMMILGIAAKRSARETKGYECTNNHHKWK